MSDRPTPETDKAERFQQGMECGGVNLGFARRLERERDEARDMVRELRDVLELYKTPYTDADLVTLAESTTGMGEIGTTEAKREIIRRHLVTKAKEVLP